MIVPTTKQRKMRPDDLIVTKTDRKGRIIYCNDAFMEYSGFYEEELLGQPHNIIRHPDMPQSVFRLMWEQLLNGDEFNGYIKNLCKDGSYYWTQANVMPNYNSNNELLGYMSTRRCPSESAVEYFEQLYKQMVEVESKYENKRQAMDEGYHVLENVVSASGNYNEFICTYI